MMASSQSVPWHSEWKTSNLMAPSHSLPWHGKSRKRKHDDTFAVAAVAR